METTERVLKIVLDKWEPDKRRTCANCRHAIVYGAPDAPMVRCERYGVDYEPIPLALVCRMSAPKGFVPQGKCRQFERS